MSVSRSLVTSQPMHAGERSWCDSIPPLWSELRWYAVQTASRHEKAVCSQLSARGVQVLLPLHVETHLWGGRRVKVELPLFPGYLFVHVSFRDRLRVLSAAGVLRIVGFGGLPTPIAEGEIAAIRTLAGMTTAETYDFLPEGQRVKITAGALKGLEGCVVKRKNDIRFVVAVQAIQQSIAVEVSAADLAVA